MEKFESKNYLTDILEKKRSSSDFIWATKNLNFKTAYGKSKKYSPADIKSVSLNSYRLKNILKAMSQQKEVSFDGLLKQAESILNEIGYDKKIPTLRWLAFFLTKILKKLLSGVYINEAKLLQIKNEMGSNPVLFVPSHKSYCDFILMSYLCFDYDIDIPRVAAGMDFHSMTIMGSLLRNVCAFFIRRSFKGDLLYSAVFNQYVVSLITHGDAGVEFFIEGTRSRTQKSLMPKLGFLSMALKPYIIGLVPDITIVPVNLSYDRVLEEVLFAYELLGVPKPKESTRGFLKVWNILDENYGNVYVTFGDPFSVKDYFSNKIDRSVHGFGAIEMQELTPDETNCIAELAYQIVCKQKELTVLTCFNLIATLLNNFLLRSCECFFIDHLVLEVQWLISVLKELAPESSLCALHGITEDEVVHHIKLHKLLVCLSGDGKIQLCRIHSAGSYNDNQLKGHKLSNGTMDVATIFLLLQYYSNPCAAFLIGICLIALIVQSLPKGDVISIDKLLGDFKFLCSIFSYEFVFHTDFIIKEFEDAFNNSRKLNIIQLTDENNIQRGSNEKLSVFCIGCLSPFFPGVLSAVEILIEFVGVNYSVKQILKTCQERMESKLRNGGVIHPANLSLDLLTNTLHSLVGMNGVIKSKGRDGLEYQTNTEELEKIHQKLNDFYLNYGWEHFWCEPDRHVYPKEYVKGPFSSPKLVCPLPYISPCQAEGDLLRIRTGIPDCWGDYLVHQLLGDYDSMHKEDVDIAHKLRKDYRLYLGQGIPNPWIINPSIIPHPGVLNCKELKENLRKYIFSLSDDRNKFRKGSCLCCEKNYLLECPDKINFKNRSCTCKTCHSKDECKCIEILQNWVTENIHLKKGRRRRGRKDGKSHGGSSESSGRETDDEGTVVGKAFLCPKNFRMTLDNISSANSNGSCVERESKREEYIFSKDFLYKGCTEKKEDEFGFFPYARNVLRGSKRLRFKDTKVSSKQIQTERKPIGDTKTVQTEGGENNIISSNKCFRCTVYHCQQSTCKANLSERNKCISPSMIKNHVIKCPYGCHEHLRDQKPHCVSSYERKKEKEKREMVQEPRGEEYETHSKKEGTLNTHKLSDGFKVFDLPQPSINKTLGYYQPRLRSFENLKYLTDSRLKNYLREREILGRFSYKAGQPFNETIKPSSEELSSGQKLEKLRWSNPKPNTPDSSFDESPKKTDTYLLWPRYVDRGVMTETEDASRKKEVVTKYFKDMVESDESRTYGLVRSRESYRKRRKLVCSKKRGKTGVQRKKLEIRLPKLTNKNTQVEAGERRRNPVRDGETRRKLMECNVKFKQVTDAPKKRGPETWGKSFDRPLRSERRDETSPEVMKFIVGDLVIDRK